ncbi:cyclic GMP-AMP synthase-like isoform X2 [Vespa mandarinia]|uniref:cyclic GMP-AMP synthase-like isoform X2 n=1 Tax=Vespa mandarinia TaxID=7446 RepID=UPI00161AD824|nr:cyclic GMP-AMP synthase-like isoform X2 [Vespa mandarinia]
MIIIIIIMEDNYIPEEKKKYFVNDRVLNAINKKFVSLPNYEKKATNEYLHQVIDGILEKMKEGAFFKKVFKRILFVGSYYKGTKIGVPEEFDINIIIKLPINYEFVEIELCEHPGFIKIYSGLKQNELTCDVKTDRVLKSLLDQDMYIDQKKFRGWMEGILSNTIQKLPLIKNKYLFNIQNTIYMIRITKSGPAFTFEVELPNGKTINVDLVPVLEFSKSVPFINYNLKQNWLAVPKCFQTNFKIRHSCWRACFYEQEKEILSKNGQIKPIIRLMKKLRDTENWKNIASYYIETIALRQLLYNKNFGNISYTLSFMEMLTYMHTTLINKYLPYYWNKELNLLCNLNPEEITNISNRLGRIINKIYTSIKDDPYIIAFYILNPEEYKELVSELNKEPLETKDDEKNLCMIL